MNRRPRGIPTLKGTLSPGVLLLVVAVKSVLPGDCAAGTPLQGAAAPASTMSQTAPETRISRWDTPRRGANYVISNADPARDFADAKSNGMNVLRLFIPGVPRDWPEERDYFADKRFQADLVSFDAVLDKAADAGLPVILVGGSVPGRQWLWNEHGRGDQRLFRNERWHKELAAYWSRVAERYRRHPAVIAYELLNELYPEALEDRDQWSRAALDAFYAKVAGTAADLNAIYACVVEAVRRVDGDAPIILDSGLWGGPAALFNLQPIKDDPRVLYSFHWYAPEVYTIWRLNKSEIVYPGCVTAQIGDVGTVDRVEWNADTHRRLMAEPVLQWRRDHRIPASRILCGEFSADRRAAGADQWNRDVIEILEANGWHWTYYAFREREWNAKDFELGPSPDNLERSAHPMMKTFTEPMARNRP